MKNIKITTNNLAPTGKRRYRSSRMTRFNCRIAGAVILLLTAGNVWALELQSVLTNTAVKPPAKVQFREQRHNPMLKEPLHLSGYLEYIKPGHLAKVVETPFNEAFVLEGGKIEIQQNGKTRRLSVNKSKPLKAMLDGIEAVLSGNSEQLAESFEYELNGNQHDWKLHLVPKSKSIAKHLSGMTVTGNDVATTSIRIDQGDDEWSQMDIVAAPTTP